MTNTDNSVQPKVWFHKNHSARPLETMPLAEMVKLPSQHEPFSGNKDRFVAWCTDEATQHTFYSFAEPQNPSVRPSIDNGIRAIHGLIGDFDSRISADQIAQAVAKCPTDFPVAYASATFSGGARLLWPFAKPLYLFGDEHAKRFMKEIEKALKPSRLLPGFDDGAFHDLAKFFELGREWRTFNSDARVSQATIEHLSFLSAQKTKNFGDGPSIPIEVVATEVHKRWPNRWPGEFAVGSFGPRVWDEGAKNPKGAWVRENGIMAFTGEHKFLPWAEVFDAEFVRKFEQDKINAATADVYFMPKNGRYWRQVNGVWSSDGHDVFKRRLERQGLSSKRRGTAMSEVDLALSMIEDGRRFDAAAPFVFNGDTLVRSDNKLYLNTARVKAIRPEPGHRPWGQGFEWIANFLEQIFDEHQRKVFLAWTSRFYKGALAGDLSIGQVLIIAGAANAGKTLLSSSIVGPLVGGSQDATAYLTGKTEFNSSLYEVGLWTVDDATALTDNDAKRKYAEILKRQAANYRHVYRVMYSDPTTIPYVGRIIITLNSDDDSIGMLPSPDYSAADKMIYLLAGDTSGVDFKHAKEKIAPELSFFAAYLRDYQIPKEIEGSARYGVQAFKHPFLLQKALDNSPGAEFLQVLELWCTSYFLACDDKEWIGNSAELLQELLLCETIRPLQKTFPTAQSVGRHMNKAISLKTPWIKAAPRHSTGTRYEISNPKLGQIPKQPDPFARAA